MVGWMLAMAGSYHVNDMARVYTEDENFFKSTALATSSENGHTKVVELLIGAKADVNKCDDVSKHQEFQF